MTPKYEPRGGHVPTPDVPSAAEAASATTVPVKKRRPLLVRVALKFLFWYVVIAAALAIFQRWLIYLPTRSERLPAADAGLSAGAAQDFMFRTDDGLELHGWHLLASGHSCDSDATCDAEIAGGRPVVLFFHGNGGDRGGRVSDSLVFCGAGADVLLIDYRGYGENPGSPSETGLMRDARALWKYATETRGVSPPNIVLYGESLGGGVAVPLAAELCDAGTPPAGVVLRSTFSSLTDAASYHYPWLPVRLLLRDRYPSLDAIARVTCPLLVVHGTEDRVVPIALGRRLFEAAPEESSSGIEKRFVEVPRADHNDLLLVGFDRFEREITTFIRGLPQSTPETE